MIRKTNKKAFTLSELLIALAIIGAIAAMSIPSLVTQIQNRTLTTQLKNISASVQQLAADQLIVHKTKTLEDTDFGSPAELLVADNFAIQETGVTGLSSGKYSSLNSLNSKSTAGSSYNTILLKNGALLGYSRDGAGKDSSGKDANSDGDDYIIGRFVVDVNGVEPPNIIGRDLFEFYVTKKGKVKGLEALVANQNSSTSTFTTKCKAGDAIACYSAIVSNSWKMPY